MSKILWTALCISLTVPGMVFKLASRATANPVSADVSSQSQFLTEQAPAISESQSSGNAKTSSTELLSTDFSIDPLEQVTSVSQLSDVQPTDWAFQALQSLVERYGCIAGYPDGTFKGNRAATRYELAAALNACLDQVSDKFATKEDLATVKALQEEFKAELAILKGRVDGLEARTATLEAQQFSTTTKLQGLVVFAGQYGDQVGTKGVDSRATAIGRVRLYFNTSFKGDDLLSIGFETGNGGNDFFSDFGLATTNPAPFNKPTPEIINLGGIVYVGSGPDVSLLLLSYTFKPTKNLAITVGPVLRPSDYIDNNSYSSDETSDFSTSFLIKNRLILTSAIDGPGGAGAVFDWNIGGGPFTLRGLYMAAAATTFAGNPDIDGDGTPDPINGGLFGDPYQATAELEYAKSFGKDDKNNVAVRLQYTRASTFNLHQNVLGINTEATFGKFGIFGRYGISINPKFGDADLFGNNNNIQTWMAGVALKDLLIPSSSLSFAVGQPFIAPGSQPTETNFEAFYRFPINDNITVTPAVMVITNPFNSDTNTVIQGLVRATFSF
ncbi:MAG: iron uptake porin [Thermosynechococcaceae cyanobacterium MS004]|nr:iron uptake porin [Thermosynechococcaceae cyanobacterium MS004]